MSDLIFICAIFASLVLYTVGGSESCRTTIGSKSSNVSCVFPFEYQDTVYSGCTNASGQDGSFWCSTLVDSQGLHIKNEGRWGVCGEGCPMQSSTGVWDPWSEWSPCTKICESGFRHRTRICQGNQCQGDRRIDEQCNQHICEDPKPLSGEFDVRTTGLLSLSQTVKRCAEDEFCTNKENCPSIQEKYARLSRVSKRGSRWKRIIQKLKEAVCNKEKKGFCCETTSYFNKKFEATTTTAATTTKSAVTGTQNGKFLPRPQQCGLNPSKHNGFIVGGETTKIGDFPFSALLGYTVIKKEYNQLTYRYEPKKSIKFKCGGTLINHWYVLTAAHCQGTKGSTRISQVVLGEWRVGANPDCQGSGKCFPRIQKFDIGEEDVTVHEDYGRELRNVVNDIALVRLNKPAEINAGVQMACLAFDQEEAARHLGVRDLQSGLSGNNATVIGWGYIGYDPRGGTNQGEFGTLGVGTQTQQQLQLPLLTPNQCKEKYGKFKVEEGQVCAGGEDGKDSCKGDSGGGLLLSGVRSDEASKPWYLIGIVSFGSKICGNGKPGVYTRVSYYTDWIKDNLKH